MHGSPSFIVSEMTERDGANHIRSVTRKAQGNPWAFFMRRCRKPTHRGIDADRVRHMGKMGSIETKGEPCGLCQN